MRRGPALLDPMFRTINCRNGGRTPVPAITGHPQPPVIPTEGPLSLRPAAEESLFECWLSCAKASQLYRLSVALSSCLIVGITCFPLILYSPIYPLFTQPLSISLFSLSSLQPSDLRPASNFHAMPCHARPPHCSATAPNHPSPILSSDSFQGTSVPSTSLLLPSTCDTLSLLPTLFSMCSYRRNL